MDYLPLILAFICLGTSRAQTSYRAAVVEFAPTLHNVSANVKAYVKLINDAHSIKSDIIVFPEIGLNGYGECLDDMLTQVPHPSAHIAPYKEVAGDKYSEALKTLSQAALDNSIYVVANVAEIAPCEQGEGCPANGLLRYNTNVVFDRNGTVIARYRKYNLFGEIGTNTTSDAEISFFDTDFGVRFGMFICFDLMFDKPALQLVKQLEIRDFVFSTAWFSELPFLTAVQSQHMWSYTLDVNFLASGYNAPSVGSGGSGIFRGRDGPVQMEFPDETTTKLIVAELPIFPLTRQWTMANKPRQVEKAIPPKEMMELITENLAAYSSKSLEELANNGTVCHGKFCCEFSVEFNKSLTIDPYRYRALVFDGVRSFTGVATGGVQACGLSMCMNDTSIGCGVRGISETIFNKINITGTFNNRRALPMPSTLRDSYQLLPLLSDEFSFDQLCDDQSCDIVMSLKKPTMLLNTFGIYSRNFDRDGEDETQPAMPDNGAITVPTFYTILVTAMALFVYL